METLLIAQLGLPGPARYLIQQCLRRVHPLAILIKELTFERDEYTDEWLIDGEGVRFIDLQSPEDRPYYVNLEQDKRRYAWPLCGYTLSFHVDANGEFD